MPKNNTYMYLSIVLAIIALIFIVLYFTKDRGPASIENISARMSECRTNILAWQGEYDTLGTTTEDAREKLYDILDNCEESIDEVNGDSY